MPDTKEVQINIVNAVELKPDKKYLLAFDSHHFTMENAHHLLQALKRMGIENALAVFTNGDPDEGIKIIEQ